MFLVLLVQGRPMLLVSDKKTPSCNHYSRLFLLQKAWKELFINGHQEETGSRNWKRVYHA